MSEGKMFDETFAWNEGTDFKIEAISGIRLPEDYLAFIRSLDGSEGDFGNNSYIQIFRLEELEEINRDYEVQKYLDGWFAWGTDLGGTLFVYNEQNGIYAAADSCSLREEDLMYKEQSMADFLLRWDRELAE